MRARGVHKRYGTLEALGGVDLDLLSHRVHALVGENGAGKSTLAKIISGVVAPDAGRLEVAGQVRTLADRADALSHGIGLVPQTLSLIGELTLVENHLLSTRSLRADRKSAHRSLTATAEQAQLAVRLDVRTRDLSLAERQLGELLLALTGGARVLVLDEPTSSLGPLEVGGLFAHLRRLAGGGTAIAIITHRIDEVREVADEVTVLCQGKVVLHSTLSEVTDTEIAVAMLGDLPPARAPSTRAVTALEVRASTLKAPAVTTPMTAPITRTPGATRLNVAGLTSPGRGGTPVHGIDLSVAGGEIVGVVGVAGSGQAALADAIAGLAPVPSGTVAVDGAVVTGKALPTAKAGLAYIPEQRADGLLPSRSIADNAALLRNGNSTLRTFGMRRKSAIEAYARDLVARYDVRPGKVGHLVGDLSGGNQQKLLSGRELDHGRAVVIAHGPTQGLDLRAADAIRRGLEASAASGAAILLISADLDEVLALADRILVLVGGRIADAMTAEEATIQRIGRSMAGLASTDHTTTAHAPSPHTTTDHTPSLHTTTDHTGREGADS